MSIHASSKVITVTHVLYFTDGTKYNINSPFRVANSVFVFAFRGLIIGDTGDVVRTNQRQA